MICYESLTLTVIMLTAKQSVGITTTMTLVKSS